MPAFPSLPAPNTSPAAGSAPAATCCECASGEDLGDFAERPPGDVDGDCRIPIADQACVEQNVGGDQRKRRGVGAEREHCTRAERQGAPEDQTYPEDGPVPTLHILTTAFQRFKH